MSRPWLRGRLLRNRMQTYVLCFNLLTGGCKGLWVTTGRVYDGKTFTFNVIYTFTVVLCKLRGFHLRPLVRKLRLLLRYVLTPEESLQHAPKTRDILNRSVSFLSNYSLRQIKSSHRRHWWRRSTCIVKYLSLMDLLVLDTLRRHAIHKILCFCGSVYFFNINSLCLLHLFEVWTFI